MKIKHYVYREESDGSGDAGGGAAVVEAPAAAPVADAAPVESKAAPVAESKAAPVDTKSSTEDTANTAAKPETKGYWPDDWRNNIAKGDEKLLGRLGRYQSPEAVAKALIEAQNKISSGELKSPLSKNPTADELKAYRAEHGIPESPDKYDLNIGRKIVDEDKPFVEQFLKNAHDTNQKPDQVQASLRAYYDIQDKITEQIQQRDAQAKEKAEEDLRAEWGGEFKRNINLVAGLLDGVGSPELKDKLLRGRLSDGTPIGASAEAMRMLVSLALINNPAGTVVPNAGGNLDQAVDDEIGKIENVMKTNRSAYNKDEKMQARYRELLGAREKLKERK